MTGSKRILSGFWVATLVATCLLLADTGAAMAEIDSLSSAINKAGRQRMLTQRIVKAYELVGLKVQTGRHKKQLSDGVKLFEAQLAELKAYAPTPEIAASLVKVETLWGPFKAIATGKVSQDGAKQLLASDGELLSAAHQVVVLLEQQSSTPAGRLVNLAGRQRMLSQRLAKFYMARAWGIGDQTIVAEMKTAADEFEAALLTELITSGINTPEIQAELNKARKQWSLYERGLKLESDAGDYIPVIMAVTSENLLKLMNKITGMYEKL